MKTGSKDKLFGQMDKMAATLLQNAQSDNVSVPIRLDIFDKVGKWLAIKNRMEDDDSGGALGEYKRRLRRDVERDERATRRDAGGGAAIATADDADDAGDPTIEPASNGGPALTKIRQSIPRGGPGGIPRPGDGSQRATAPTFVRDGGVLPVAVGTVESRSNEAGG